MRRILLSIALSLSLATPPAAAATMTGSDFIRWCESANAACEEEIDEFAEGMYFFDEESEDYFCPAGNVDYARERRWIVAWFRDHPAYWNRNYEAGLYEALLDLYPC